VPPATLPASFDFDKDEVGKKAGGQKGTIYVEGAHLCPGTPEELVNLTIDANNLEYDEPTYRRLIDERAQYEARYKEPGTRPGTHKYMCPALGKQAPIECPLREVHPEASKKAKPCVLKRNLPKKLEKICTQHSVTIEENDDTVKSKQEFQYGSREWATNYEADRNMVEGMNGFIKAENKEALASAARRSAFGLAAQQVFVTMLIVSANMRKLQSFLKDEIRAAKMKNDLMIEKRRHRLRDHPEKGWGRYKRKWGPPRAEISVPGRDSPLQIVPLKM